MNANEDLGNRHTPTLNPASPLTLVRLARGFSRAELGRVLGVHPESIGRWERGEYLPRGSTLTALANLLGVDATELFRPEGDTHGA